jgi:hypothetical protein
MAFSKNWNQLKVSFEKEYDADGTVWTRAIAHGTLTAKTPYKIIVVEYGQITAALADDVTRYYVGVPAGDVVSGDECRLQIGGYISGLITPSLSMAVGHAMSILDGAVADVGADYSGLPGQFAVTVDATTTSTTQTAILIPERILATT